MHELHHPLCDTRDRNAEGIVKPCNCPYPHRCAVLAHERGDFIRDMDGFIYYSPTQAGHFSAAVLRVLADELDRLNGPWNGVILNDPAIGGPEPGANA